MKKSTIVLIIVIFLTLAGVVVYTTTKKSSQSDLMMAKDSSTLPTDSNLMMKKDDTTDNNETMDNKNMSKRYIEYSNTSFENASETRRVLFFFASWCPTCKPADESFVKNISKIPEDVTLIRVNYNDTDTDKDEKDLAKKYDVTYQHTFVQIDDKGNVVTKWNGGQISELLSNIK